MTWWKADVIVNGAPAEPVDAVAAPEPTAAPTTRRELAVARALDTARSRAENRVELFLDAARDLMNTNATDFTVQEVVERSGQSLRTFYQYFAGKYELLLALFEESVAGAGPVGSSPGAFGRHIRKYSTQNV